MTKRHADPGRVGHELCIGLVGVVALSGVMGGCRGSLDGMAVMLERHRRAVAELPEEERENLMPYGAPVVMEEAEALLPAAVLDMEKARAIAIRANPDIHAAQARLESARARIAEIAARYYPTVMFTHTSTRTFHTPASRNRLNTLLQPQASVPTDTTDTEGQSFAVTTLLDAISRPFLEYRELTGDTNPFSEHSTSLTASWTVFDGFVREAQLLASKHVNRASWAALRDAERLILQAVDRAYYQVQLAQEQIRIAEADVAFSKEQLEETEKLRAAGRKTAADVANFRVRMLAAQTNVTSAIGARDTGRVVLGELMGLPDAVLPPDLELVPLTDETEEEMRLPDPDDWVRRALASRPDLLQQEHLLGDKDEQVRAVQGLFLPTVAISGSWGFDHTGNLRYAPDDQSSAAVLEFRWELFTGGSRRAKLRQAQSARAEAMANLNHRRLAVQADVRQAIIDLKNAQEQIRLQRENVVTAQESRRVVQAGYVAGKETLNRLNETQRDYTAAEVDLVRARIQLRRAWSDLNAAAGTYHADAGG